MARRQWRDVIVWLSVRERFEGTCVFVRGGGGSSIDKEVDVVVEGGVISSLGIDVVKTGV